MNELLPIVEQATAHLRNGDHDLAVAKYREALRQNAQHPELRLDLGSALLAQGRLQEAREQFQMTVQMCPAFAKAHYNLALVQSQLGEQRNARNGYLRALALNPDLIQAHINLGNLYRQNQEIGPAISHYRQALQINPHHVNALIQLGSLMHTQGHAEPALKVLRLAVRLDPACCEALEQLGLCLIDLMRVEEALRCFMESVRLDPQRADALCCAGAALKMQGYYDEALRYYEQALAYDPAHAVTRWNRALLLLLKGCWAEGWADFHWRWHTPAGFQAYAHRYTQPLWKGESFVDRRLLVHYEQGLGDVLQFLRYLPQVKARGGTVLFETPAPIESLIRDWDCIDEILLKGNAPVACAFDLCVSLMDLPVLFQTTEHTIPKAPYLHADPGKVTAWASRFPDAGFKIGIAWAGGGVHHRRLAALRLRACRLSHFAALADLSDVRWYGLQKDTGLEELQGPQAAFLTENLGKDLHDFSDTAAAIAHLDLVISVDTAVAHLAGALGKPTWLLLREDADWRWQLDREDSPWYPSMRLFRQRRGESWDRVMERVREGLKERLTRRR